MSSHTEISANGETDEPRIGYVGLDHHHAEPYLQTLETLPVSVVCACEPNRSFDVSSIDGLGDVPVYDDPAALFDDTNVDVVFLTLSNRDTPAVIEYALKNDIDIFTEKPVARTTAELKPLVNLQAASDATVCVSYPWQGHPIARKLKALVEEGFFGEMRGFEARFVASQLAFRDVDHFIFDAEASRGGILQWLGIHWIHLLSWLLEAPITRVNAQMVAGTDGVDVEDSATLQLETADGAVGTVHSGYYLCEGTYDTQLNLYGTGGRSNWDPMGRTFGFDGQTRLELDSVTDEWASSPHRTVTYDYEPEQGYGGSWGRGFVREFLDARTGGGAPPVGLEDALTVLRILDAAYESNRTDQWVTVES